jgi:glycosyltransferase involved in cell wall biosynthesis
VGLVVSRDPSRRPVVAINALSVNPYNAGTRTMLTELVPALRRIAPHLDLLLVCHPGNRSLYPHDVEVLEVQLGAGKAGKVRRVLYDLFRVPRLVSGRADVLVTPSNVGPVRCRLPHVAVIAAHLALPSCQRAALPERMPRSKQLYFATVYRRYIRDADVVLGISEFLAHGLVEELHLDPARVRAMPLGVKPPAGGPSLDGRGAIILFVGTLYRYKDGDAAVRAFAQARDRLPTGARLVIAGKDHRDEAARLAALADECGVADAVEIRGSVPFEELEHLFRTSGVLLMPSKGEGFGLPVAEAMGYGLPVVAADATALPGVAGGAAVLVPPGDVDGFAEALVSVLGDPQRRQGMVERGLVRSAELSWDAAAQVLGDAIDTALAGGTSARTGPASG